MPAKLSTTVTNIEKKVHNQVNKDLLSEFYAYLKTMDTSENYQNGLLKVLIRYAEYLEPSITFYQIQDKEQIIKYLDSKRKTEKVSHYNSRFVIQRSVYANNHFVILSK